MDLFSNEAGGGRSYLAFWGEQRGRRPVGSYYDSGDSASLSVQMWANGEFSQRGRGR